MNLLLRATLALFGVGLAVSTSQAFWLHRNRGTDQYQSSGATCPSGACGPAMTYVPETRDVCTTRYRQEVRYVPETVVQRVTVMVPRPVQQQPTGCQGFSMGCFGMSPPSGGGCFGTPPSGSGGCFGNPGGCAGNPKGISSLDSFGGDSALTLKLTQLEDRLNSLDKKLGTLETAVHQIRDTVKTRSNAPTNPAKITLPTMPIPTPGASPVGSGPLSPDSLAEAAQAYKARKAAGSGQAAVPVLAPSAAITVGSVSLTRR